MNPIHATLDRTTEYSKLLPNIFATTSSRMAENIRIAKRVEDALMATGYVLLREVDVTVDEQCVVLRGRLPSYYLKQVAQAAAAAVSGEYQINDQMDVVWPAKHDDCEFHSGDLDSVRQTETKYS